MSRKQDKSQMEQIRSQLKAAEGNYVSKIRASDFRLLKLALIMAILALIAGLIYGRIQL